MARDCPLTGGKAVSQDCIECELKLRCKSGLHSLSCIGVDQSYKRTGVSISVDGKLAVVRSFPLEKLSKHEARSIASKQVKSATSRALQKSARVLVLLERIRLFSHQFISMPYILSMGMMNGAIYDTIAGSFGSEMDSGRLEVMTIETRAWKKAVVGTTKGAENSYGVPESKWPSVEYLLTRWPQFEDCIMHESKSKKQTKKNFELGGKFYEYDDDAVDSACISLVPWSSSDWPSRLEAIE